MSPITGPAFGARRIALWGFAWSLGLSLAEAPVISRIDTVDWQTLLAWLFLVWMMPVWWLGGCAILWAAQRGERHGGTWGTIAGLVIASVATVAIQPLINWTVLPDRIARVKGRMSNMGALMPNDDAYAWISLAVYQLWVCLFYGGLLVLAYTLISRRERMQRLLHVGALARGRAESLLSAERLQAQQSQIDPHLLLAVMQDIERRYRGDPEDADRLLAALVDFLQCAMPGLREHRSTVDAELALARAYLRLQAERGLCASWSIDTPDPPERLGVAFPSLLMLPLLALATADRPTKIDVESRPDGLRLSLNGLAQAPGALLQARIRHCLTALQTDIVLITTTCQGEHHVFRRNG